MNEHYKTQVSSVYVANIYQLSENRAQRTFGAIFFLHYVWIRVFNKNDMALPFIHN